MIWIPKVAHIRPNCVNGSAPVTRSADSAPAHTHSSSRCRAPAAARSARSRPEGRPPPPRSSLARQTAPTSCPSHHRPVSANSSRARVFKPAMKAAVHLDQLAEVRLALAASAMRAALARATPQSRGQHPSAQRLVMDDQPVFARQMLGRQRRPKSLVDRPAVLRPNERQHPLPHPARRHAIRRPPRAAMAESRRALGAIAGPTTASPADNSPPSRSPPSPASTSPPPPAPRPPPASTRPCSSLSVPLHDLRGRKLRGTFLTSRIGDTIQQARKRPPGEKHGDAGGKHPRVRPHGPGINEDVFQQDDHAEELRRAPEVKDERSQPVASLIPAA